MLMTADPRATADPAAIRSVWQETAAPRVEYPALAGKVTADVAVVGAGYTGLSAALHLAEAGLRVTVIDAREPGWGASGRNGGQVIPGLKYDPPEMLAKYGPDLGARITAFVGNTPQLVFDLIARHGIACDARRCGWIQPAHNAQLEGVLKRRAESWAATGADVETLDKARVAELLGTNAYLGGWLDRRAGALNPLSYARGLAAAAARQGVAIHGATPATRLDKVADGYVVHTPHGQIRAGQVILATNGYTGDLWKGLRQTIVSMHSYQVATDPLPEAVRATILPQGQVSSDSRRVLLYFRLDREGRFLMGGVGATGEGTKPADFAHLVRAARQLFPQVMQDFTFNWYGRVALTMDFLPHLHELAPGLHTALGYNGRGVGMATALGSLLARRVQGEPAAELPFPTTTQTRIPFHFLRNFYVAATRTYYRLRDKAG